MQMLLPWEHLQNPTPPQTQPTLSSELFILMICWQ
uniref:Uncharacterized protein n=1 Tax=Anguilla anguilla TaxID=7936 RepID=A0A0E9U605_ANGAN